MTFVRRFVGVALLALASGAAMAAQPLLTAQELRAKLSDPQVRVIDIRDGAAYGTNHIPGAVNAPYGQWRGPADVIAVGFYLAGVLPLDKLHRHLLAFLGLGARE